MDSQVKKILIVGAVVVLLALVNPSGANAAELIKGFEVGQGKDPYLRAVPDTNGFYQIGYGSIYNYDQGRNVKPGDTITRDQAERYLLTEINKVSAAIDQAVKVRLTRNQKTALISLVYNIGTGAFNKSTLLKYINERKPAAIVADRFNDFIYAESRVLPGLVARRKKEAAIYVS